jgi:hypothetical protein
MKPLLFIIAVALSGCGLFGSNYYGYSPLEKYMQYHMIKDINASSYPDNVLPMSGNVLFNYMSSKSIHGGMISNTNYYYYQNGSIIHYPDNSQLVTNLSFSTGQQFGDANARFWVRLEPTSISIFNYSNILVTNLSTGLTKGIACLGHDNSGILAYGIPVQSAVISGLPVKYSLYLLDLDTGLTKYLAISYGDMLGFSRMGKYLFYSLNTSMKYYDLIYENYCSQFPYGMLVSYNVSTEQETPIGNVNYENKYSTNNNSIDWFDFPIGLSEDMKTLIVNEYIEINDPDNVPLDDGRLIQNEVGVWYIDISSLGLSE